MNDFYLKTSWLKVVKRRKRKERCLQMRIFFMTRIRMMKMRSGSTSIAGHTLWQGVRAARSSLPVTLSWTAQPVWPPYVWTVRSKTTVHPTAQHQVLTSLNVLLDFLINMINNCLFSLLRSKLSPTGLVNLPRNKLGVVCLIIFLFYFW